MEKIKNLFWFRRDLRITDNHGLYKALNKGSTICCFIWDKNILSCLKKDNPRIGFIYESLIYLKQELQKYNRVRMICASFLCKDLLINWRWGEKYFAEKLIDYELASNNGNWQWCASTGCDAHPYFRIFNPYLQSEKFDPEGNYIKKYVPELFHLDTKQIYNPNKDSLFSDFDYPSPIVNHQTQVKLAKILFAEAKKEI